MLHKHSNSDRSCCCYHSFWCVMEQYSLVGCMIPYALEKRAQAYTHACSKTALTKAIWIHFSSFAVQNVLNFGIYILFKHNWLFVPLKHYYSLFKCGKTANPISRPYILYTRYACVSTLHIICFFFWAHSLFWNRCRFEAKSRTLCLSFGVRKWILLISFVALWIHFVASF